MVERIQDIRTSPIHLKSSQALCLLTFYTTKESFTTIHLQKRIFAHIATRKVKKIMRLVLIFGLYLLLGTVIGKAVKEEDDSGDDEETSKRGLDAAVNVAKEISKATISDLIGSGVSLTGTTATALMNPSFSVSTSGTLENYSRWPLRLSRQGCDVLAGTTNVAMRTVSPGMKEGFASHKTAHTAKGSWIFCPFNVDRQYRVMFMYSIPYDQNLHSNTLAVAICESGKENCRRLNGDQMYYNDLERMEKDNFGIQQLTPDERSSADSEVAIDRHSYYYNIRQIKACLKDLCITGEMGSAHKTNIKLRVMPKKYEDLSQAVQGGSQKNNWNKEQYEEFVEMV